MHSIITSIILVASVVPSVMGLGINCEGSDKYCTSTYCPSNTLVQMRNALQDALHSGNVNDRFKSGDHITCFFNQDYKHTCCAFFQTAGASGGPQDALNHINNLLKHGCKICGSDPLHGNDVSKGQLTVNSVGNSGPNKCLSTYCG